MITTEREILVYNDYGSLPWLYPLLKEWADLAGHTLYHFVYTLPWLYYYDHEGVRLTKQGDAVVKLVDTSYVPKRWEETPFVSLHLNSELAYYDKFEITKYNRDNLHLIQAVKNLPELAKTRKLEIVKIPFNIKWEICNYDGYEWVAEAHQKWYSSNWRPR